MNRLPLGRILFAFALAGTFMLTTARLEAQVIANPASLVDRGSYVTDTSAKRDWLKFSSTAGLTYEQAVAAFSADGWRVATGLEVQGFMSLFGWVSDTPYPGVTPNNGLTDAMASYLGYTTNSAGNPRFIWATIEDNVNGFHWNTYAVHSQDDLTYHDYVTTYNILSSPTSSNGVGYANWMTRPSCALNGADLTAEIRVVSIEIPEAFTPGQPILPPNAIYTGGWWAVNLSARPHMVFANRGCAESPATTATLSVGKDGSALVLAVVAVPAMPPGGTSSQVPRVSLPSGANLDWRFFGSARLVLTVDPNNVVGEADESNNASTVEINLVDPRPQRVLVPLTFANIAFAEALLSAGGFNYYEVAGYTPGWTKALTGPSIRSRQDGQLKSAACYRIHAEISKVPGSSPTRYRIVIQGGPRFGEPNPLEFYCWDLDPVAGYVRKWHLSF